ncbi:sporulation protein YqfC [Oceanobacillus locisalsi]|uniref:Sporulation protein YqfC n=1 Tax=Oceanobacillus locisalsi TaxID=546107 RepID=A0ABW3NIS3_9BACI
MKKWQQRIRSLLMEQFSLPSDVVMEMPRITIIGHLHFYIENHQGLALYTNEELKLKVTNGFVSIKGHSFVLKMMLPKEIMLEGTISEVLFLNHENGEKDT